MSILKGHRLYYFFLILILSGGLGLSYFLSPNKIAQLVVLVAMSIFYCVLGFVHHAGNHDLQVKIMLEYVLIASLALACGLLIFKVGFGL